MQKIRIAVVGLNFGGWMVENELLSDHGKKYLEIAAVCDFEEQKVREWAETLQVPAYTSLQDILEDPSIEAVALFTGPVGRADLIERITEAGKHVITTKPFEKDSARARAALDKARSLGRVVHLNSPSPTLSPDLLQIQNWIDTYDLGRPIAFRAETTCSYREQYNGTWYDDPELCPVPPIFRLGIYLINDCIRFFGDVSSVNVMQSRIFTGRPTADNAQLNLRFENGALGNIFASFCIDDGQYYKSAFVMNFQNGTIYRNMGPRSRDERSEKVLLQMVAVQNGEQIIETCQMESQSGYQWDVFYKTVRGERTDSPSYAAHIEAGIRIMEMIQEGQ